MDSTSVQHVADELRGPPTHTAVSVGGSGPFRTRSGSDLLRWAALDPDLVPDPAPTK